MRNEPNHPRFLLPQYIDGHAASGTIYRGLYLAARRGRKAAGQSHRQLLFGETAPRGTSRVVVPLRFLRQALSLTTSGHRRHGCQELHVDAIAHHPYTTHAGPAFVPRSAGGTAKRAYDAFRLPLVARLLGRTRIALWGLVRPASGRTTMIIEFRARGGKRWHRLERVATTARGTWTTHTVRRRYRVRWTAPDGTTRLGPLTRVHRL
ncbi:MAG: hypothetical protein ACR2NB_07420 [Solirubrobacteraceae bacterium]